MDLVNYSKDRYDEISNYLVPYLKETGFDTSKVPVVPVSGKDGVNLFVNNNDDIFTEINDKIIEPNNYKKMLPDNEDKKYIIDWGHHIVRYGVLIYNLMLNIIMI